MTAEPASHSKHCVNMSTVIVQSVKRCNLLYIIFNSKFAMLRPTCIRYRYKGNGKLSNDQLCRYDCIYKLQSKLILTRQLL